MFETVCGVPLLTSSLPSQDCRIELKRREFGLVLRTETEFNPPMDPTVVSKISRIRGWLLIILGICLGVGMTVIGVLLAWIITHNDQPGGTHWTGSREVTVRTFELLATVFIFGAVAAVGGSFQLTQGRTSRLAMLVLLGLVAVMCFLGREIIQLGR